MFVFFCCNNVDSIILSYQWNFQQYVIRLSFSCTTSLCCSLPKKCPSQIVGNGVSEALDVKIFWRGACPQSPVVRSAFVDRYVLLVRTPSKSHATPLQCSLTWFPSYYDHYLELFPQPWTDGLMSV